MAHQDRLNIAVFIDFDNIEIGVKSTLNEHFDAGTILDAIKERGEIVSKIAYADWTRAGDYSRHLTQHAIRLVQRNLTPGGDKNGADINMALDALEMAFTHPHINAYVIVGGDSDFLSLVEKLKQYDKKVFVVGGRAFTSIILQRNCHEFIAYENLTRSRRPAAKGGQPTAPTASAPVAQAVPIVRRALKILSDREVSPQTGLLKSTLLQLDSTFSERNYGASSFLDFVEKLAQAGVVQLKHAGRSVMVELAEGPAADEGEQPERARSSSDAEGAVVERGERHGPGEGASAEALGPAGTAADGVRLVAETLRNAAHARWPMYLRNVKQILRASDPAFDERRYGFGGLMDLLRACQRDGLVRLERDRRGGLRVFPGANLQRVERAAEVVASPEQEDVQPIEIEAETIEAREPGIEMVDIDAEAEPQPAIVPVDTTAELLGRATPKRGRGRTPSAPRAPRKAAARKPAARRSRTRSAPETE